MHRYIGIFDLDILNIKRETTSLTSQETKFEVIVFSEYVDNYNIVH